MIIPEIHIDASGFRKLVIGLGVYSRSLGNNQDILEELIKNYAIDDIKENFITSGHGRWEKHSPNTDSKTGMLLIDTGTMFKSAVTKSAWRIKAMEALYSGAYFRSKARKYANFHITGTQKMPERNFAALSMETVDRMADTAADRLALRFGGIL